MKSDVNKAKLSISISPTLASFIESYQKEKNLSSRSEAVEKIIYWFYCKYIEEKYYQMGFDSQQDFEMKIYEGSLEDGLDFEYSFEQASSETA